MEQSERPQLQPVKLEGLVEVKVSATTFDGELRINDVVMDGQSVNTVLGMAMAGSEMNHSQHLSYVRGFCRVRIEIEPIPTGLKTPAAKPRWPHDDGDAPTVVAVKSEGG